MKSGHAHILVSLVQSLRADRSEGESAEVLAAALEAWWDVALRKRVARSLQHIIDTGTVPPKE